MYPRVQFVLNFFLKEIKIKTEKGKEDYKSFLFSHSVQRAYEQLMLMFT